MSNILDDADLEKLYDAAIETSYRSSAAGSFKSQYQKILAQFDRFGYNLILPNHELTGLTFFTRPKLNLSTTNLRQDRILSTIDTLDNTSLPFSIRSYLDTKWSRNDMIAGLAEKAYFFNSESPFINPLTNCLVSLSGFPDIVIDTETSEGGFFGETITMPRGSDMLRKNYDFSITFRDIQGGYIFSLFYIWARYIELVTRGIVMAYPEDIDERRMCFTSSIYRFILDPSRRYITKWAKATGCFPKSLPTGTFFNVNERESFISSTAQFTVPFQCNGVEQMDPIIFRDFNSVVYEFSDRLKDGDYKLADVLAENNFAGIPYIDTDSGFNELKFVCRGEELIDPIDVVWKQLDAKIRAVGEQGNSILDSTATNTNTVQTAYTETVSTTTSIT